jgi:hypothetical protein
LPIRSINAAASPVVSSQSPEGNAWTGLGSASIMVGGINMKSAAFRNHYAGMIRYFPPGGSWGAR